MAVLQISHAHDAMSLLMCAKAHMFAFFLKTEQYVIINPLPPLTEYFDT